MNIVITQLIAQSISNPALGSLGTLSPTAFFGRLIPGLLSFGLVIGVIVFLFILLQGAILWIASGGDKMKIEQAKSKLSNALVGIIILLSFFAIINLVECFFGIGLRSVYIGPFNISLSGALNCP
jgi:hypothetical protein